MWLVIRLVFVALAIYIVVTASAEQKSAMMGGLRAFAGAAQDACTRNALCSEAVGKAKGVVRSTAERVRQSSVERTPALLER